MGVGVEHDGNAVFEYIDIATGQADGYFARAVGGCCIEHHIAIALFFIAALQL